MWKYMVLLHTKCDYVECHFKNVELRMDFNFTNFVCWLHLLLATIGWWLDAPCAGLDVFFTSSVPCYLLLNFLHIQLLSTYPWLRGWYGAWLEEEVNKKMNVRVRVCAYFCRAILSSVSNSFFFETENSLYGLSLVNATFFFFSLFFFHEWS